MFKSLLNTLPVLSGNFTLACKLINTSKNSNKSFESCICEASIKPLDENIKLYKSIAVNLMNGKYSFDVKKYASIIDIHKNVYKNNYTTFVDIDETSQIDDRNKVYEYGCKRISYEMNKNEWSFYAPFYINNFEDIPDYFIIDIKKKDSNQILKQIKVYIGKRKNNNKLYFYLKRHIEQITNNIPITWQYNNKEIILHNAIDYVNGVIMSRIINSNSQILYSNHVTINEFDSMLNNLYYDNGFILSEVIPLSFEFTLSDFLEKSELKYYQINNFDVSGYYIKNDKKYPFYVFETNSHNLPMFYKKYDYINNEIITEEYNLYNKKNGKNSLHEATNIILKNNNTISKQYCKWVNYDNQNYYINNNISYSTEFGKYGDFPIFKNLTENRLKLKVNFIDGKLNAWVPNKEYFDEGLNIYTKDAYSLNDECVIYNNMIINNISTWFEMWLENNQMFYDLSKWGTTNKFNNSCFYKGIIYQNLPKDTDYFGVFLKVHINDTTNSKIANILIDNSSINYKNKNIYHLYNNEQGFISTNTFIQEVKSSNEIIPGEPYYEYYREDQEWYIRYSDVENVEIPLANNSTVTFGNYFSNNENIKKIGIIGKEAYEILDNISFSNINNYYQSIMNDSDISNDFSDIEYKRLFENELFYLNIYNGEIEPIINLLDNQTSDMFNEYIKNNVTKIFKKESFIFIPKKDQIYNIVLEKARNLAESNIPENIVNLLSFNFLKNNDTVNTPSNIDTILNYIDSHVFINKNATLFKDIKDYLLMYKLFYISNSNLIKNCQLYYYVIDNSISNNINICYFRKYEQNNKNGYKVYVDSYNLNKIIPNIDTIDLIKINNDNNTNHYYCKFIDLNHFKEYCKLLHTEDTSYNINEKFTQKELLDTLYCKRTIISGVSNITNRIAPLKNYIYSEANENIDIDNSLVSDNIINEILNNISYGTNEFLINVNNKSIRCELFFKKELVELTTQLKEILENITPDNTDLSKCMSNYMYYYSFNNLNIYKKSFEINSTKQFNEIDIDEKFLLSPIFESVYLNYDKGENFVETNKRFFNSLIYDNLYSMYNPTSSMYVITDNVDINDNRKIYKIVNINFAEIEKNNDEEIQSYIDPISNKKFCYFLINEYISNNTVSYNLYNSLFDKMTLDLVNIKEYNKNIFLDIYPFIKNDIFLDIVQQIKDWVTYPTHVKLKNVYKYIQINNKNNSSLIENNQNQYIYLNRYFGDIMPCLTEIENNISDMYKKIYKTKNYNFKSDNNSVAYVLNKCNIFKNQPIYVINSDKFINDENNELDYSEKFYTFYPVENKHFMNSLLYHMPNYIEITTPNSLTIRYNDIEQYEDVSDIENSQLFKYFKKYINSKFYNKIIDENNKENIETLLFLFKLYSYTIEKNIVKYNIKLNTKLYSITYKFNLK